MTPEKRRENGRKGGLASVKKRREKKAMKENLEALLSMSLKSGKIADVDTIRNFAALKMARMLLCRTQYLLNRFKKQ